ncbi:hypothetical protein TUM4261_35380 [Shewanella sp. c952]|nr:hypothetical protein TUM4261_35380 [Shewanella sp. c952]
MAATVGALGVTTGAACAEKAATEVASKSVFIGWFNKFILIMHVFMFR